MFNSLISETILYFFLSRKINFVLANRIAPYEMLPFGNPSGSSLFVIVQVEGFLIINGFNLKSLLIMGFFIFQAHAFLFVNISAQFSLITKIMAVFFSYQQTNPYAYAALQFRFFNRIKS